MVEGFKGLVWGGGDWGVRVEVLPPLCLAARVQGLGLEH